MDKDKAWLWAVRIVGLACLAVFVLVKASGVGALGLGPLMNRLCPPEDWLRYGDLYGETQLRQFKILLPAQEGPALVRTPSADAVRYDVFVMGDSFMPFRRGHETFVRSLSERLGEPIDFEGWDIPSPTCLFRRLKTPVDKGRRRLVIIERVERQIIRQFSDVKECPAWTVEESPALRTPAAFADRVLRAVFDDPEQNLRGFFSYCVLTRGLVEAVFSLRFALFGIITDMTPVYSLHPPFVFTRDEADPRRDSSYYHYHDDAEIARYADNLAAIRDALKSEADAELVFMPIPSKYTIEHKILNDDPYDRFLPRLYEALEKRGVRTVRLYDRFAAEPGYVYYPTDTHWNPRGIDIALDETMRTLRDMRWPAAISAEKMRK